MKTMSKRPVRSLTESRVNCGESHLAGKSLILPNKGIPVVVQNLTRSQIAAIPRSRYRVKLIGKEGSGGMRDSTIKAIRVMAMTRKVGVVVKGDSALSYLTTVELMEGSTGAVSIHPLQSKSSIISRSDRPSTGYHIARRHAMGHRMACKRIAKFRKRGINASTSEQSYEEKMVVAIELLKKAVTIMNELRTEERESRNTGGGGDPDRGIFSPAINEDELSDSVYKVKDQFFGNNDYCMINGKKYDLMAFCYLVFLVLARMGIIVNKLRKPYCEFLQEKVFMDKIPSVRNFNNCANKEVHKEFEDLFPKLKFGFIARQPLDNSKNELYLACHEIGWAFHETDYFKKLKRQRNSLDGFTL